jgi:hypothetical protein
VTRQDNKAAAQLKLLTALNAEDPAEARALAAELGINIDTAGSQEQLERLVEAAIAADDLVVELTLRDALALAVALKEWRRSQRVERIASKTTDDADITATVAAALRKAAKKQ